MTVRALTELEERASGAGVRPAVRCQGVQYFDTRVLMHLFTVPFAIQPNRLAQPAVQLLFSVSSNALLYFHILHHSIGFHVFSPLEPIIASWRACNWLETPCAELHFEQAFQF